VHSDSLLRQLGEALAEAGRPDEAVTVLRPLAASGADPAALQDLAVALSDAGKQDEATTVLKRAVELYPGDPLGYEDLGIVELRRGEPAAARDHLRRALAMNGQLATAWNTLGVALYQLHDALAALDAWHRAARIDATQYDALFNAGLVAAELGRTKEAREALESFLATAPKARFAEEIAKAEARLKRLGG
jgi:tetratricopeptide (TPR) repeat protein